MGKIEDKLKELGHSLPLVGPSTTLEPGVQVGSLVFTSGVGSEMRGKLGCDLSAQDGYKAAQECGLQLLVNLKGIIGDLDKVTKVVKLLSLINSAADFEDHPTVANGCTDLLVELFGEKVGKHARSAVGVSALPGGRAVEIEMVVQTES